ncbi:MAG TPA: MlaD family protein [Chitinophagaceae bacterium]|jgi:phospholipid/cholesterol/gamma-HCH transport system substrate-binding protein|nr:MlaD family protein [Chitinophagaceae bacterium]
MKLSNEMKVGLLAIVAVLFLVLGFNFLKGKSLFSKQPVLYAVFPEIGGLGKSNEVKLKGLTIGTVYNLKPMDREVNNILVEIHLNREVNIPRNSIAYISASLVGASTLIIEKGDANAYLAYGDTLNTRLDAGLVGDLKTQITPTISRVNNTIDTLTTTLSAVNDIFDPATNQNLRTIVANLAVSSGQLAQLLNMQSGALAASLNNMNAITGNLAKNNDAITSSIRNVEVTTSKLANSNIEQTVAALQGTVSELRNTIQRLSTNLNSTDGTLGALMNDRKLYDQLNRVALGLEILLDDVRVHPKRYVNISVFGGKNKPEPLTSPAAKDTVPSTQIP